MKKILAGFIAFLLIFTFPSIHLPLLTVTANETVLEGKDEIDGDEKKNNEAEVDHVKETNEEEPEKPEETEEIVEPQNDEHTEANDTEIETNEETLPLGDNDTSKNDTVNDLNEQDGTKEKITDKEIRETEKENGESKLQQSENSSQLSSGDFQYTDNGDGTATITGYSGGGLKVNIPYDLNGLVVTAIGAGAFSNKLIWEVDIPNSVKAIGDAAFSPNMMLRTVTLHNESVSIGNNAFSASPLLKIISHVPSTAQEYAANNSQGFQNIKQAPEDIFTIDNNGTITAYHDSGGEVEIPNEINGIEVTGIADWAFQSKGITSVIIPDSVTSIGNVAFYNNQISNLTIPEGVRNIGHDVFHANQITSLTIPSTVTNIGKAAFYNNQIKNLTISEGMQHIGESAFTSNQLTEVEFPTSVTSIGANAFSNNKFSTLTIPNHITSIGDGAYSGNQLTELIIPEHVTSIGSYAFSNNELNNVTVKNPSVTLGSDAFAYNNYFLTVFGYTPSTAKEYAEAHHHTFKDLTTTPEIIYQWTNNGDGTAMITGYTGNLTDIIIPDAIDGLTIISIGSEAFRNKQLQSVTIPESVIDIGTQAFADNQSDPADFTIIGYHSSAVKTYADENNHAFIDRESLPENNYKWIDNGDGTAEITSYIGTNEEIVIPDTLAGLQVTSIKESVFSYRNLTSVIISDNIKSIGDFAFLGNRLTHLEIPNNVTKIGEYAFQNNQLETIIFSDGVTEIENSVFRNNQLVEMALPDSVKVIGNSAFRDNQFVALTLPDSVTDIGDYAFENNQLVEVTIPDGVKNIGENAFRDNQLLEVALPDSVRNIGNGAFRSNQLSHVSIPTGLVTMGYLIFANNQLTSLTISEGVTAIGTSMFLGNNLTSVTIPASVTHIGNDAFSGNNLHRAIVLNRNTNFGDRVFYKQSNLSDFVISSHAPSKAKDYAESDGYQFIDGAGTVNFPQNGNSKWEQSHSIKVDVNGYDENQTLEYAWTTNSAIPTEGWSTFSNGSIVTTPTDTGEYYLHVKGTGLLGDVFHYTSKVFSVDNTNPTLMITPNTEEQTHDDVDLTVKATDAHSGIKQMQDPAGNWHNQTEITYEVKQNGTYTFIVEDDAGNQTTESIEIINIDKTISFEIPTISSMSDITLSAEPTIYTTDMTPIKIKDWRDEENDWRLDVSASRLKMANGDDELPTGTIKLKPISEINRIEGTGSAPVISRKEKIEIDNGQVTIAETNNSRGEFEIIFPGTALEFLVDPTTVKVNNPNGTTYETTITWGLITAP